METRPPNEPPTPAFLHQHLLLRQAERDRDLRAVGMHPLRGADHLDAAAAVGPRKPGVGRHEGVILPSR